MSPPSIDVLLASYNGEKYLNEQIASVLNQTHSHLRLLIRDDGSQDSTPEIIKKWAELHPSKVYAIHSDEKKGAKGNFSALMKHVESPYVMFCDQDDIWMKDKAAKSLALIHRLEQIDGPLTPCLVHTDLKVVNQDLTPIAESFWNFAHLRPCKSARFSRMLMQNVVTGCTAMMNRSLLNLVQEIPNSALMHDWWIALAASAFGHIGALPEPTVLYRQHPQNVLGAQKFGTWKHIKKALEGLRGEKNPLLNQAKAFHDRYRDRLDPKKLDILNAYLSLSESSWAGGRYKILRYGLFKNGLLRNLAAFFLQNYSLKR